MDQQGEDLSAVVQRTGTEQGDKANLPAVIAPYENSDLFVGPAQASSDYSIDVEVSPYCSAVVGSIGKFSLLLGTAKYHANDALDRLDEYRTDDNAKFVDDMRSYLTQVIIHTDRINQGSTNLADFIRDGIKTSKNGEQVNTFYVDNKEMVHQLKECADEYDHDVGNGSMNLVALSRIVNIEMRDNCCGDASGLCDMLATKINYISEVGFAIDKLKSRLGQYKAPISAYVCQPNP